MEALLGINWLYLILAAFAGEAKRTSDAGTVPDGAKAATDRFVVRPWLPHQ